MTVALVVISDGRIGDRFNHILERTIASVEENVDFPFVRRVIVDDSGLLPVYLELQRQFPGYEIIHHRKRSGIAAAVQTGWDAALETDCEYLFHLEQDFTFNEPVDLDDLIRILKDHSWLANVTLKRQPWSPVEIAAGDFMRVNEDWYRDDDGFVEWSKLFSCNPSLIRREVVELAPFSTEGDFARTCKHAGFTFAFYGQKADPPRVTHIGEHRALGWKP